MKLIEKAYAFAKEQMQYDWKEVPGSKSNPRIAKAYACVDGLGNPEMIDDSNVSWCSVMMNYIIQSVGGRGTRSALARSWLLWGKACQPKEGCLMILKRGNSTWQGHICFFIRKEGEYVYGLGGNQSDDFKISRFKLADVLDFRTSLDS